MNHKVWLTVFGVIAFLVIGASGFYAFTEYQKYSNALSGWDEKVRTIESLERKVPYPNKGNAEALAVEKDKYNAAVEDLFKALNTFQRPLNKTLLNTEFQENVRKRVQDFRSFASEEGMGLLEESSEFQLGFDVYATNIPQPELVAVLDYELEAIDRLLRELVTSGAEALLTFDRDPIPGEEGGAEDHGSNVVHKYPIRMRMKISQDSFQHFINKMANDKDFFYILRVLKVKNDKVEGPIKLIAADGSTDLPVFVNSATQETAGYDKLVEWGLSDDAPLEDMVTAARAEGFELNKEDARVLMGQEMLNVFMVVDITRFVSAAEQAAVEKEEEPKSNSRKR